MKVNRQHERGSVRAHSHRASQRQGSDRGAAPCSMKRSFNGFSLVFVAPRAHCVHMRTVLLPILIGAACWADAAFGIWTMNAARSTFPGDTQPKSFTVRIEPHPKGEVFTLERIETDGRTTSSSTILYFDGAPRDFQDFECSGTQSSWRRDSRTVEILRKCGAGAWTKFVRRTSTKQNELVLEITEQHTDGRRFERRLTLER